MTQVNGRPAVNSATPSTNSASVAPEVLLFNSLQNSPTVNSSTEAQQVNNADSASQETQSATVNSSIEAQEVNNADSEAETKESDSIKKGDLNGDGEINFADQDALYDMVFLDSPTTLEEEKQAADINGDGIVDQSDWLRFHDTILMRVSLDS